MLRQIVLAGMLFSTMLMPASSSEAQNVSGYDTMTNPYLLLLREPAVHQDLKLTTQQRTALRQFNDELDGQFMSHRNKSREQATKMFEELVTKTRDRVNTLLDENQRQRLSQIMLRVQGIKLVVRPKVAERLKLSSDQQADIQKILDNTSKTIADLQKKLQAGEPRKPIEASARRARQKEHEQVIDLLNTVQQRHLTELLGSSFDSSRLDRVKLKPPELVESDGWVNSKPIRLSELRGKVVALHFWTFG